MTIELWSLCLKHSMIYTKLGWGVGVKNCQRDNVTEQNELLCIVHILVSINSDVNNVWSLTQNILLSILGKYENSKMSNFIHLQHKASASTTSML